MEGNKMPHWLEIRMAAKTLRPEATKKVARGVDQPYRKRRRKIIAKEGGGFRKKRRGRREGKEKGVSYWLWI